MTALDLTLGSDVSSGDELDETRIVTGRELVAQDVRWRLMTPRAMGILAADAPDYGLDLLGLVGSAQTAADAAALPGMIRAELTKDDRIDVVDVKVARTVEGAATSYAIRIECETADGPFALVGSVADAALDLAIKLLPEGV